MDKITLAALQATLLAYLENKAVDEIPVWRMIAANPATLGRRARRWQRALRKTPQLAGVPLEIVKTVSTVGGGSLPGQTLPTQALAIGVDQADALAERLRTLPNQPPVVTRIENNRVIFDPRTVLPEQDKLLIAAIKHALLAGA